MPWFERVANFACECMFFAGNVLTDVAIRVTDYVDKARTFIQHQVNPQQDTQRNLHDVNLSIEDLLCKKNRDRGLSPQDQNRLNELKARREQLKRDIWSAKEQETLRTLVNRPDSVRSVIITPQPQHLHIVQYHVGQTVTGKRCPICGSEMMLRLNDGTLRPFWGCVHFFNEPTDADNPQCLGVLPYRQNDRQLFTPSETPEFKISNDELSSIYNNTHIQNGVAHRMGQHQQTAINEYLCPTHGERLVLREKRRFQGALDQFFLGCPRWKINDPVSCDYLVKIKTPAQLAAVLKSYEGRGIL